MAEPQTAASETRSEVWDLWRRTLSPISSVFGRLRFIAGLRDVNTGRYSHATLSRSVGQDDADRTLRSGHQQVFRQWLGLSLAEQMQDLEAYLSEAGASHQLTGYRELSPPGAHDVERQLYLADLEILLELMDAARSGA